jgi:thiazole synthase
MSLGSPIGSGQGLNNRANLQIIIEDVNVAVIVDSAIETSSEAMQAMKIAASGVLFNTAVVQSRNPF